VDGGLVDHSYGMGQHKEADLARWRGLVSEQVASGTSVAGFCRDRGLRDWQFYEWKKRLRSSAAAPFIAVAAGGILLVRQLSLSFRANLRRRRKCPSAKSPRLHVAEDVPYSPTIQGVGVDRLRRAVGTFRNVIVARWACKVVENVARDGIGLSLR